MTEREACRELDSVGVIIPVPHEKPLREVGVDIGVIGRRSRKTWPLSTGKVDLVLTVGNGDGKLGRGIDVAKKHVCNGVAGLLPWHEVDKDGCHPGRPRHKHRTGNADHNNSPPVGLGHRLDQLILVPLAPTARVAGPKEVRLAPSVKRQRGSVRAFGGKSAHKDNGHLRLCSQRGSCLHVAAIVEGHATANYTADALQWRHEV
mmetsp:Transcript_54951/g.127949  ORF Transcript_54951/g.127949 Transcript_54951/m.127949 type:complete len:204 (-) Transcript_54951:525-1136(-)